jgi:hypothetical protein
MEVDRIGEVSYKWIMLRRQYGDDLRFVPIPDGCDGEKIEWITLRVVAVKLGIPFSAFGPVAADYLAKFGEIN